MQGLKDKSHPEVATDGGAEDGFGRDVGQHSPTPFFPPKGEDPPVPPIPAQHPGDPHPEPPNEGLRVAVGAALGQCPPLRDAQSPPNPHSPPLVSQNVLGPPPPYFAPQTLVPH